MSGVPPCHAQNHLLGLRTTLDISNPKTGKIYQINETQQITEKFSKREFVLELSNNPAYVEKVLFTLTRDKIDSINEYKVGDTINVKYNLKGREWTSPQGDVKFFNTFSSTY